MFNIFRKSDKPVNDNQAPSGREINVSDWSELRKNVIGNTCTIETPFGTRRLMYADYVASGRAFGPIEDKIRDYILPLYANTHTESSATGRQTTAFREQARAIIARSVGATDEDAVIFCGSGCTGAVDKLIRMLRLKLPKGMGEYGVNTHIAPDNRPVVFIGPFEHHSNDVQWRETIADVVMIEQTKDGLLDIDDLEKQLKAHQDRPLMIGSFSAGSNVTGILTDPAPVAKLLHKYGALAAFDFAAAAPYIPIEMNAPDGAHLDAVFISTHKFLGGPGTPGLLVLKKKWAQNNTPVVPGGGTVSYVSPCAQSYLDDIEHREEGGTPEIVGAIRAGLVFDLREQIGAQKIAEKEIAFAKTALKRWGAHNNIQVLGSPFAKRLPVFSFLIKDGDKYLHFNYVVALLNDLFGVQARGGCSCAGPYGHRLLNIDNKTSLEYESVIRTGVEILKPGWVRVGFNYFYSQEECELLLRSVEWVADHGAKLLPLYKYNSKTGHWAHRNADKLPL
ncbi:MAG TPA: aminotransferase class V-fold PLP-dependent enzyme, partial [Hellea balneolensis]|nr:aminotransferase class V-fold PLP-dependent enzyme [Hellea balneolensis]